MCGIAGIFNYKSDFQIENFKDLLEDIGHRGPDNQGLYSDAENKVVLGHRRLSIIDLSEKSNQPLIHENRENVIVFNGEIYNFKELAKKYSLSLETNGDVEVLLKLFVLLDEKVLDELKGMFAFAIYSKSKGELFIARDRAGIKPLYYSIEGSTLKFGSEFRVFKGASSNYDLVSISNFLNLGYFPKDQTILKGVKKLKPGNFIRFKKEPEINKYHQWNLKKEEKKDLEAYQLSFRSVFKKSIEYRLITDRKAGVFLSGGIDSSLVAKYASEISGNSIESYCVSIEDSKYNEAAYAERVAKKIGIKHFSIPFSASQIEDELEEILFQLDEPFGDSSYIPFYILSKVVNKEITVALSGDGGDELFLGYGMYEWAKRLSEFPLNQHSLWKLIFKYYRSKKEKDYKGYFDIPDKTFLHQNIFSHEQGFFNNEEISQVLTSGKKPELVYSNQDSDFLNLNIQEKQAFLDFSNYLPEDLLMKVDRASMYNSLEVRVPFLDKEVIDFALSLPMNFKKRNKVTKYILKEELMDTLGAELVHRKKWGFSIPMCDWLLGKYAYLIDKYLNEKNLSNIPFLNGAYIENLVLRFRRGEVHLYNRIWLLLQLTMWIDKQDQK